MDRRAAETHIDTLKWFDEKNAKRIARGAAPIPYPDDIAGEPGEHQQPSQQVDIPDPATGNLTNLIDLVEESDLDVIGFVLFRTHYSDQQSWDVFEKGFYELLDEGIAATSAESGFNRVEDKVFMRIVSDDSLEGQSPEGVSGAYRMCMEEDETTDGDDENDWGDKVEPGLTTNMCLLIDEECVRSVLNKTAGSTPFVKAVDSTMGMGQALEYGGTVKVAITSLVPAFYAALLVYSAIDVASKVSDDGIWRNIGPWDPDIEGRRALQLSEQ